MAKDHSHIDIEALIKENNALKEENRLLRLRQRNYRSGLKHSPDIIFAKDLDGKYIFVSYSYVEYLGQESELNVIGKSDYDFFSKRDADKFKEIDKSLINGETKLAQSIDPYSVKGKKLRWAQSFKTAMIDEDGEIVGTLTIAREYTEVIQLQKKFKEIIDRKDELFSTLIHDLRSPIANIKSLADHLINAHSVLTKKELVNISKMVYDQSESSLKLLKDVFEWATLHLDSELTKPQLVNLVPIVDEVQKFHEIQLIDKNITVEFNDSQEFTGFMDPKMLTTVVRNILSNAIKFSEQNSHIKIYIAQCDQFTRLSIQDFGAGMNALEQKRLFNINKRFSKTGTNNEKGHGYGLILCMNLMNQNYGTINVESEKDKGSTFHILIPKNPAVYAELEAADF